MAEAFLARLPKVGRGVLAKEDQHCPICMEEYGTTPSTSGTIERAVRLPCNHVVGSECISIWLTASPDQRSSNNNTCPICRHDFFHIEPLGTDTDDDVWYGSHMQIHVELREHIFDLGDYLSLSADVTDMAVHIANRIHDRGPMGDHSLVAVAAGSVYMAGYALEEVTPLPRLSRVIAEIGLGEVGIDVIQRTYHWLYRYRRRLILESLLTRVAGYTLDTVDVVLPYNMVYHTTTA